MRAVPWSIGIAVLAVGCSHALAETRPAESCELADVQAAVDAASAEICGIRFQSGTATHGGNLGRGILVYNNRGTVYRCSFDGGLQDGAPSLVHTAITLKWLGEEASKSWTTPDTLGANDTSGL